jgi:hypothetical protein
MIESTARRPDWQAETQPKRAAGNISTMMSTNDPEAMQTVYKQSSVSESIFTNTYGQPALYADTNSSTSKMSKFPSPV